MPEGGEDMTTAATSADPTPLRVLVIDDHELVRDTLVGTLESAGYEVDSAADGEAGLEVFSRFRPDVVITDILMPQQEGLQFIGELKKLSPEVRILAISGGGSLGPNDVLLWARTLGADEVLAKPFTREQILGVLEDFGAAAS